MAETLQARREWRPIFNILKEKNFQHRILYPAKQNVISRGEVKFFYKKANAEYINHHQACLVRTPEGSTKYGKEKLVSATLKTHDGSNPKFKSTKSPNQKIQPNPNCMLHPDPFDMQGYTQTQNKGMEKDLPTKQREKINK